MTAISAHRCDSPEALRRALVLGVDYLELDVRRAQDGTFVVAHDPIDVSTAPPLAQALEQMAASDVGLHLDLKSVTDDASDEVAATELAVRALGPQRVVVTTLHDHTVRAVRDWAEVAGHDLLVGLTVGRGIDGRGPSAVVRGLWSELFPGRRLSDSGANLLVAHRRLAFIGLSRYARRRGIPLLVWTVDHPRSLRHWLSPGRAWLVTTNHPAEALRIRQVINGRRGRP